MKIRDLIDKITDQRRYGHLMILFFSDLDKEINDVIKEYEKWNPEYIAKLRNLMKEFGIKEEIDMTHEKGTFVIVYEMCPKYLGTKRDWHWISEAENPEDALKKFETERPRLVEAGICILHVAKVIR